MSRVPGRWWSRSARVGDGERVLAAASAVEGRQLCGTRRALFVVPADGGTPCRFAWEEIHSAAWDRTTATLTVRETDGTGAGEPHPFVLLDSRTRAKLLDVVRERVQASILLQRPVPVPSGAAVTLVLRRGQGRGAPVRWVVQVPGGTGLAADDRTAVREEAERVREELGLPDPVPVLLGGPS